MTERTKTSAKAPEQSIKQKVIQTRKTDPSPSVSSLADRILLLQRTIGNQAVQRLMKTGILQTKLRIGQPNDIYEQEADRVADQVMRMTDTAISNQHSAISGGNDQIQTKPG
jgi:predicted transcriptional regulator